MLLIFFLFFCNSFLISSSLDSPERWQVGFQDPASPIMQGVIDFHHDLFFFLIVIMTFVFWLLVKVIFTFNSFSNKNVVKVINYGTIIEIIWTIVPALILILVAIPSFTLLYSMDELIDPMLTIKVIGRQWFWSYEYADYSTLSLSSDTPFIFDSYMVNEEDLELGQFRLLEVDQRVVVPTYTHVRFAVTASDVIHSWAIPSLGIKLDACPGRLNQVSTFINRPGVYYGQCSELCGINHGFMPIVIEAVTYQDYASWIFIKYSEENL